MKDRVKRSRAWMDAQVVMDSPEWVEQEWKRLYFTNVMNKPLSGWPEVRPRIPHIPRSHCHCHCHCHYIPQAKPRLANTNT
eukprot:7399980-Pyramimonas_sp.AAC.2